MTLKRSKEREMITWGWVLLVRSITKPAQELARLKPGTKVLSPLLNASGRQKAVAQC